VPVRGAFGVQVDGEQGGLAGRGEVDFGIDDCHEWGAAGAAAEGDRERSDFRGGGVPDSRYYRTVYDDEFRPFQPGASE